MNQTVGSKNEALQKFGQLRSLASQVHAENPEMDEEEIFEVFLRNSVKGYMSALASLNNPLKANRIADLFIK